MSMNPTPRKLDEEDQKLIEEYLKNGGTVTVGKKYERTEDLEVAKSFYGRKPKAKD